MTIGELKKFLRIFSDDNDALVRLGADGKRFDYVDQVDFDHDANVLVVYTSKEL